VNPVPGTDPYDISVPGNALALSARVNRLISMDRFQRQQFEREWFRNVLFVAGNHWVVYDRGKWRPKNVPSWFPRAMTNKCAEKVNDFVTTLLQSGRVPINYLPARGDDEADKAIAEIGERIRDVMYEEAGIDDEAIAQTLGAWVGTCGNGFLIPYYDLDAKHGTASVSMQSCAQCGKQLSPQDIQDSGGQCPDCQGIAFQPAQDDAGNPVTQDFAVGRFRTDVCSPFEIRWDHRITAYSEHKRFTRMRMWDLDFAKEKYKDVANQITADHENDLGQFYLNALAHVTASFGQTGGFIGGASNPLGPKTVVYEHYELPDDYYPEGIKCTRVGANSDLIVEAGPLPSEYTGGPRKGQKFLPLIHFGFDIVPGRLWRKTRLDDVIPLQIFRNMVEASLRLTAQRMANPVWLNPKGSGISIFTGEPGQVFDYNPMSVGGTSFAKPERIPAELSNVGPLIQLMNKIDDSIERVMGTFFLQGGDAPPGVTAASALAYLGEKAQRSMAAPMRSWALGWKVWEEYGLEIMRGNASDERMLTIAGKNREWETQKFKFSELTGSVKMRIDYNGLMPKSVAAERANIGQLIQLKVLNPMDPEVSFHILEAFGETNLKGSIDVSVREAVKENEKFIESQDYHPVVVPIVQDAQVHIMQHKQLCGTDEFKALPEPRQQEMFQHIHNHFAEMMMQQQMIAQAAAAAQPGAQGPGGPGQPTPPAGPQGPDNTNAIQEPRTPDIAGDVDGGAAPEPALPAGGGMGVGAGA
jgi:hypothetical protein